MAYGNEKAISQASAKGKVKWFNATKGYGFITLDNGGDAFCHASALQATGHSDVQPGTTIICDL
ncbi:MAG TPA: cold shock domain-containing protein, partial [Rhizomicrobium sp.]|nr:cold shock domain-containing protein [Rhizomicrobium sp.]